MLRKPDLQLPESGWEELPLTELLHRHLTRYGTAADGRLFRSLTGGGLWRKARATALTAEECASPMGRRPYDLRHACVST